jgi:hypothetical protein
MKRLAIALAAVALLGAIASSAGMIFPHQKNPSPDGSST